MKTNRIDHALLALMAIALAVLPFYTSGYVIYVVNLLLVFVVLALGLHRSSARPASSRCRTPPSTAWASTPPG